MKKSKTTTTNLIYNMIYQVLILILPLITAPYVSRIVGAEGIGIYSYFSTIALYFNYFSMLGISNHGNRTIAKNRDSENRKNEVFSEIYTLQLILSLFISILYILFVLFIIKNNRAIAYIMFLSVVSSMFDVSWTYFGLEEFKTTAIRQIVIRLITLICIFLFVKHSSDLYIYTIIMSLGSFISSFILWILLWKKVKLKKVTFKRILANLKPCLILFIPIVATSVYRHMDKIMIGSFTNMFEVGYYENAEKVITISLGLISSFSAVMMPKISNLIGNKKYKEADNLFDKSMEYSMLIGIAIFWGIIAVAKDFIPIFFGEEFIPSIRLCIFLCFSIPFICWANIVRVLHLIPREKDKIYVCSIIFGALLNLIFNFIFIPKFQAFGAVIGTLTAESGVAIFQTVFIRNSIKIKEYLKKSCVFLVFGFIMFCIVRLASNYLYQNVLGLSIEIIIGIIVYMILSIMYMYKTNNEIFFSILNKFKIFKGKKYS